MVGRLRPTGACAEGGTGVRRALRAGLELVAGDDALVAGGIALTLGGAGALARAGVDPWSLVLVAVPLVLGWSLRRAGRKASA